MNAEFLLRERDTFVHLLRDTFLCVRAHQGKTVISAKNASLFAILIAIWACQSGIQTDFPYFLAVLFGQELGEFIIVLLHCSLETKKPLGILQEAFILKSWQRPTLPHSLPCSTISARGLDFRVRNGIGYIPSAMVTKNFFLCYRNSIITRPL